METPFKSYSVRWRIGDQMITDQDMNNSYPNQDIAWFDYPLDPSIGRGGFRTLKLTNGISLHNSEFVFEPDSSGVTLPSAIVQATFKEPALVVNLLLSGKMTRTDRSTGTVDKVSPKVSHIHVASGLDLDLSFAHLPSLEIVYLIACQTSLTALIGRKTTARLFKQLETTHGAHRLPAQVTGPLKFCFDERLTGSMHKLHAQARALEFLETLIRYLDGTARIRPVAKELRAQAVHDLIRERGSSLPSSTELAKMFGVSGKTLNQSFSDAYGMSITRYLKEQRLAIAHEQLLSTNLSVQEICTRLGYSQVSNFSAAFKAFYGYPPAALRRSTALDR